MDNIANWLFLLLSHKPSTNLIDMGMTLVRSEHYVLIYYEYIRFDDNKLYIRTILEVEFLRMRG
jgi:hypothetical protein